MISVLVFSLIRHFFGSITDFSSEKSPHKSEDGCDATCISESNYTYAIELGSRFAIPTKLGLRKYVKRHPSNQPSSLFSPGILFFFS